jgi:3D (Asp-Asp-Asp) domain-containing protein
MIVVTQSKICIYKRGDFIKQEKVNYIFLILKILVILLFIFEFTILLINAHGTPVEKININSNETEVGRQNEIDCHLTSARALVGHLHINKMIMASDTIVRMSDIFIAEEDIVIDNIAEDITNEPCEPEIIIEQPNNYIGTFEGTWYCATDMGYSTPPYGSSGRILETGYSVASNYFPSGTLLYIEGTGVTGTYRVDDTGGMSNNVIDFYYWDRAFVPQSFLVSGRINIEVYIL